MSSKMLNNQEIESIVNGFHTDPFSVLGPHKFDDVTIIRVFDPTANSVFIKINDDEISMNKIHDFGLFELQLQKEITNYKLKIIDYNSNEIIKNDVYNFPSVIGDIDDYLFCEGRHFELFNKLGAQTITLNGVKGVSFAVWAPTAYRVSVIGNFNNWDGRVNVMRKHLTSGLWDIFIPDIGDGELYKFELLDKNKKLLPFKTDPFGFFQEMRPKTASIVWDIRNFNWQKSAEWNLKKDTVNNISKPISIYEVHLGSWRKKDGYFWLNYRELANELIPYVKYMGFTHIEIMPVMEYPFDDSWGYQTIGMFAPTSRYGTPTDFKYFINECHKAGIAVILDWVSAHFPKDEHGLINFDGTALYEYSDVKKGEHKDWGTKIYDYGKKEVVNFLFSSALFWLKEYRVDGLRFDAVASMLYLDYSKKAGEWTPNKYGGHDNLEAIDFLKNTNILLYEKCPNFASFAEESTSWKDVSKPVNYGGLGFGYKWNMGWMHDILLYFTKDPVYRKYHQHLIGFTFHYAFAENFVLPISHDEVVYGKQSLLSKMPGDEWQKFANLRLFLSFMWSYPGKKLLFMGSEFGQCNEWNKEQSLDWHLLNDPKHKGIQNIVKDLNLLYTTNKCLYEGDCKPDLFEWICGDDTDNQVFSYIRYDNDKKNFVVIVLNMTPVVRYNYRVGVPQDIILKEIFNSDDVIYGGSNIKNRMTIETENIPWHNKHFSINITVPPLSCVLFTKVE